MNSKMTTNSQLSTTEPKKQKQTKQTTRTGTESQKWRSYGGFSAGKGGGRMRAKIQGIRSISAKYEIRQGKVNNSIGNGEAKELICTTHGRELRSGECWWGGAGWRG